MESSCSSSVTVSQTGSKFVQHYYEVLQHQPQLAHRFYTASSSIIRVDGESTETASDISEIQKLVESLHLSRVEFQTINSVESGRRGITVVVSGSVRSDCFTGCRKFVETFFLAPHEKKGYLVINDIFHFVSEKHLSDIICTRDSAELLCIWRNNCESVEDFLFRFIRETMRFPEAIDQLKIAGFIEGVCDDELVRQLRYPKSPQKFETLIQQVKSLVMVERLCAFNKEDEMRRRRSACPNNRKRKKFSPYGPKSWMEQPITFPAIYTRNYQGPFVITATIADYSVSMIHIDEGSASEILFESCFDQILWRDGETTRTDPAARHHRRGRKIPDTGYDLFGCPGWCFTKRHYWTFGDQGLARGSVYYSWGDEVSYSEWDSNDLVR
ncbi:putative Ras GTPase-activating protein-binding protein [Helianthus annuus]|nr:putative Ras GTPase-activating protein-binding protein [Helianthus annuus]